MHLLRGQHIAPECADQRVQQVMHLCHPAGHRGAIQLHPVAPVDAALPVQRQVVAVLGDHDVRQQSGACGAAADRAARRRRLPDRLALRACQLRAHGADHLEARRHVLQVFRDVLADAPQAAAARAAAARSALRVVVGRRGVGAVFLRLARQVPGQRSIHLATVGCRRGLGLAHRHFIQWCNLKQAALHGIEPLAGGAVQAAIAPGQLELELGHQQLEQVAFGLAGLQTAAQLLDLLGMLARTAVTGHDRHCASRR
jgi:hypothetical protein